MSDLVNILQALMSHNNDIRKNAEVHFQAMLEGELFQTIQKLMFHLSNGESVGHQLFCAILLRRIFEEHYEKLTDHELQTIRSGLLDVWMRLMSGANSREKERVVNKVLHVISQLSCNEAWPTLLPTALQPSTRQSVTPTSLLSLLEIICEYCPEEIDKNYQAIGSYLAEQFSSSDKKVLIHCAKAASACIAVLEQDDARSTFKDATIPIINIINNALNIGDEIDASGLIENLVNIAQVHPTFFKATFDQCFQCMITIAATNGLEFSTRSIALEWLVTIAESAPAMARKCTVFAKSVLSVAFAIAVEVDDDQVSWSREKYNIDEGDFDDDSIVGEEAIERVSKGLGGKASAEIIISFVQQFTQPGAEWKLRRAAIAALSRLTEGVPTYCANYLPHILPFITQALQYGSSVRVQYEAIQTIGRLALRYPDQVEELVNQYLPMLATILQNNQCCPKLRGHAASALINLLNPSHCEAPVLEKFVDPLLQALNSCLQSATLDVQSPCLVVVGCVARICPEQFSQYYQFFMPGIKQILVQAQGQDLMALKGKAIECAGLIGEAVGTAIFAADAREITSFFIHSLSAEMDRDMAFDYILPACARIAKALKTDFLPYLPVVLEVLEIGAKQDPGFTLEDADDDEKEGEVTRDDEAGTESTVIPCGGGSKMRLTINSHAVQQKNQAARIYFELATALGSALGLSNVLSMIEIVLLLVVDKFSNNVRASAACALGKVFEAYVLIVKTSETPIQYQEQAMKVFTDCIRHLLNAIRKEPDTTTRSCQAECLRDLLRVIVESADEEEDGSRESTKCVIPRIPEELLNEIISSTVSQSAECVMRRQQLLQASQSGGKDAFDDDDDRVEAIQEEIDEEEELLTIFVDTFGQMLKLQRASFMGIVDRIIIPAFSPYLQPNQPEALQIASTCLIDDVIEFGGDAAWKYLPNILPVLLKNANIALTEENEDDDQVLLLKQCSMYGLAIIAKQASIENASIHKDLLLTTTQYLPLLLHCFLQTICHPKAKESDIVGITENAVFGLGCLLCAPVLRGNVQSFLNNLPGDVHRLLPNAQSNDLVKAWLTHLPLRTDAMEAKASIFTLTQHLVQFDPLVLGPGHSNLPEILRIFAEVMQNSSLQYKQLTNDDDEMILLAHPQTVQRIEQLIRQLPAAIPVDQLHAAFNQLPADAQTVLKVFL